MKQLSFQFPPRKQRAVQTRTVRNQQPVTWHMNESEASFLMQMLNVGTSRDLSDNKGRRLS